MPRNKKLQVARQSRRLRLDYNTYLRPYNTVPAPTVETAIDEQPVGPQPADIKMLQEAEELIKKKGQALYHCFRLQLEFSLRISEVTGIACSDITARGEVRVRGKKGGKDRFITPVSSKVYFLKCRRLGIDPFAELTESFIYRSYVSAGLKIKLPGRKKNSVTHIFRHLAAISARESGFGNTVISDRLGHNSSKSQEHYGK